MERFSWILDNKIFLSLFSLVSGALLTAALTALRNRLARLEYNVTHERVALSAQDAIFGSVRVTWQNQDVTNLYVSTVRLENPTNRDFSNVRFRVYTGSETFLLTERTEISGTSYIVQWSPEFSDSLTVPEGAAPTQVQFDTYRHRREYLLPVFNRGKAIVLTFLTTVPGGNQLPGVWLDMLEQGITVRYRVQTAMIHGVPVPVAALVGLVACLAIFLIAVSFLKPMLAAGVTLVAGLIAQSIGAVIIKSFRGVRNLLYR